MSAWLDLLADPERLLMFTAEVYRAVLAGYNRAAFVVVAVAALSGVALSIALLRGCRVPAAVVYVVLAALWFWLGGVFHAVHFAQVNLAAPWQAVGALAQGVLLSWFAFTRGRRAKIGGTVCATGGLAWLVAALLFGPAMALAGTPWDAVGYFGTAPHTLGFATGAVLILTQRAPWWHALPAGVLGIVDAGTAAMLGERAIAVAWLLLALTLASVPWCRRRRSRLPTAS